MTKRKLRIGVLVDSQNIPAWAFNSLSEIHGSDYSEIVLFIQNNQTKKKKFLLKNILELRKKLFYILFMKMERKIYKNISDPFKLKNIKAFSSVPIIPTIPEEINSFDTFNEELLAEVKRFDLDVIIKLGFRNLKGEIIRIPKYGVWSYHHGDNLVNKGTPPGFWEVMESWIETGSVLQILSDDSDNERVIYRSYSLTDARSISRNLSRCLWKTSKFVPRKLKELYCLGDTNFYANINQYDQLPSFYSNRIFGIPNNHEMINLFIKYLFKYLKQKYNELFYKEQWHLQYNINKNNMISVEFHKFKKIIPPKDRFWADPDFLKINDKYYIFFEEYLYSKKKGHISVIELDQEGNFTDSQIVLQKNFHISFPFIFSHENYYYMIPETSRNKTIELYKSVEFPYKWEFEKILMNNIVAVDSNIFHYQNKWWLFTNIKENEGALIYDELFLFFSDNFKCNKWHPHPKNPIISDVKSARPAGHIFYYKKNIYRPSQNCSKYYGYGMKINQIIKLNENEYEEKVIDKIEPNWNKNYLGTHTLNYKEDFTIIDVRQKIFRFF